MLMAFLPLKQLIIAVLIQIPGQLLAKDQVRFNNQLLKVYLDSVVGELPEYVQKTLNRIPNFQRKILAANVYFRRADELERAWSWTAKEVAEYKLTAEYARMLVDIEQVKQEFTERNPGYHLRVNIGARSLETQIKKWNSVSSVGRAAREFIDSCRQEFSDSVYEAVPDSLSIERFRAFMERYEFHENRVPTVAIPGLSKHGQLRAFDFKVMKGRRMLAGANSATIPTKWDKAGWTEKLKEAVFAVSHRFEGPLPAPYEPWHYNYWPDKDAPEHEATEKNLEVNNSRERDQD